MRFASCVVALGWVFSAMLGGRAEEGTAEEVFKKRILPIFQSPNPSSCVQCHLADVDLKDYILPDPEKTFRNLRDQGLIDLKRPEQSKIVQLIERGQGVKTASTFPIGDSKAEREAFIAWIKASAADPRLRDAPVLAEQDKKAPASPKDVIRHGRKDQLLKSFEQDVWAWRFRCMNCHTEGTAQNDKMKKEHGPRVAWVKKDGAEATMEYLIESRLIDFDKPDNSLLLRKPLGEKHGGGLKFVVGDQAYKGFRAWIEDLAAIKGKKYATARDLPAASQELDRFGSDIWFKLDNCPPSWGEKLLEVRIFAWSDRENRFERTPIATSDRLVAGKAKLWQHNLTLLAPAGSEQSKTWRKAEPSLAPGKYLARIYVDDAGRTTKAWKTGLGESDFVGEVEFQARWRPGYGGMSIADASQVVKHP